MSVSVNDMILEDSLSIYDYPTDYEETIYDLWQNCIVLSFTGIVPLVAKLILTNLWFGIIISSGIISEDVYHILSGSCGIYLISSIEYTNGKIVILLCFLLSFILIYFITKRKHVYLLSNFIKFGFMFVLIFCEYLFFDPLVWAQIRGPMMIFTMKLISLTEYVQNNNNNFNFIQYFGYIFCGSNILFGPWISYDHYIALYKNTPQKNFYWAFSIIKSLVLSVFFLMISNCFSSYFIPEGSHILLTSYKEALSFRTSHYFISFLSEASMLSAGFKSINIWSEKNCWKFTVTNPLVIEFPTALSLVVVNWNRPMHEFLKKYVYRAWVPKGKFIAVFATFVVSSLLHGSECHVSVVLITIGVFSYIQYALRDNISSSFNCCVKVHPCKDCTHENKRNTFKCRVIRGVFSILTVLHLIFLGILMDSSTNEIGIYEKWNQLYFYSIWIMAFKCCLIYL